jgi:hypothetical protein
MTLTAVFVPCKTNTLGDLARVTLATMPLVCIFGLLVGWVAFWTNRVRAAEIALLATWPSVGGSAFFALVLLSGPHGAFSGLFGPSLPC